MNPTQPLSHLPSPLSASFPNRLVTLCDGRPGLRGALHIEARVPAESAIQRADGSTAPVIDFIASDETLDRYHEVIAAQGWRLENYLRNPVFQNAHQYGDVIFTLGRALCTEVRDGRLCQRIEFATDVNPMARIAYGLYKGKFLNAVSVGFIPLQWENGDGTMQNSRGADAADASLSSPKGGEGQGEEANLSRLGLQNLAPGLPSIGLAKEGPKTIPRRKYLEQELLEVSAVGIPANPNALQLGLKAGAVEKSDLRELAELLHSLCPLDTSHLSYASHSSQLLKAARDLRTLLRQL